MPDEKGVISRVRARLRGILPQHWFGRAGDCFRQTTTVISDYARENIRLDERLKQAPDLAWTAVEGAAHEKRAKAIKEYESAENERIENEFRRQTLTDKMRQEKAAADKSESEARIAEVREIDARIELFDKLKQRGLLPLWDAAGKMTIIKAAPGFDWAGLQDRLLQGADWNRCALLPPDPEIPPSGPAGDPPNLDERD